MGSVEQDRNRIDEYCRHEEALLASFGKERAKPENAEEILQYLTENGLIDLGDVQAQIADMNLEKQIKEFHSHDIWQGKDGRWRTYIFDENAPKKRKLVAKKTKHKLLEFLVKRQYPDAPVIEQATIRTLYPLWLEHKSLMIADTYITRIKTDWKKYYENDPIVDRPIESFNKIELESWILHLIKDHEMTKNCFYNASMIIRQVFQYAYDSEILKENTFDRVKKDLGRLFRKVRKPMDETQTYTNEEIEALEDMIWNDFRQDGRKIHRLAPLAVLFQLYTGMRVSEVCALKYSDILENGKLHIQRMLVKDTGEVRERTKGFEGERTVYLPEKAREIIRATLDFRKENNILSDEFIFSVTDKPFPERTINEYLERYCKRLDIPYRSSHKLRKTALSSMVNAGISLNAVRAFAGHVDESTTLKYYVFDREKESTRNEQFERALSFR